MRTGRAALPTQNLEGHVTWTVLTGAIEWWADEVLRDIGLRRFHERPGRRSSTADARSRDHVDMATAVSAARRVALEAVAGVLRSTQRG